MMRRAKPILAAAAVLSLAACGWMGGADKSQRPSGSAGLSSGESTKTAASQQYPQDISPQFVQQVQQRLGQRGYDVGPVDGVWGDSTQTALRNFQRDQRLPTTGQIDTQTLAALGIQSGSQSTAQQQQPARTQTQSQPQAQQQPYQPTTRRGAMMQPQGGPRGTIGQQQSMDPGVVRDVQQELQDRGYQVGQIDGMWGRNTRQAVTSFQRDQNLQPSGRIDQQTLAALGIEDSGAQVGQMPAERPRRTETPREQARPQGGAMPDVEATPEPDIGPMEERR